MGKEKRIEWRGKKDLILCEVKEMKWVMKGEIERKRKEFGFV